MNVIPALEGREPWECGAMPAERPLPSKRPEGKWARIECEVWRGWFYRGPSCPFSKPF